MAIERSLGRYVDPDPQRPEGGHGDDVSPASKLRASVLDVLKREGYIRGYQQSRRRSSSRSSSSITRAIR